MRLASGGADRDRLGGSDHAVEYLDGQGDFPLLTGQRAGSQPRVDGGFIAADPGLRLAAVLADATNLGLDRMAAASYGVTRDKLVWMADAYIRPETYQAALTRIIDAHHALPVAATGGDGTTSASDRQFFRSAKRGDAAGDVNVRYGPDPGLGFYSVRVMSATSHEAPYVLDGLMHHGTALRIETHYADTEGSSDHVFILCAMLRFRSCPRLRDLPDRKLATLEPASAYKDLAPLLGCRIRTEIIREHWDEILRMVTSLHAGTALPSAMLKRLAAYQRQKPTRPGTAGAGPHRAYALHAGLVGIAPSQAVLPRRAEQERAAPRARPGRLHLRAGAHRRPWPGSAAVPRFWAQPGDRCQRLLELDLRCRRRRAPARRRRCGAGRAARSHLAADLGAHRPLRRLPLGPCGCHGRAAPAAQPRARSVGSMSGVQGTFTHRVVCVTADAMPSRRPASPRSRRAPAHRLC